MWIRAALLAFAALFAGVAPGFAQSRTGTELVYYTVNVDDMARLGQEHGYIASIQYLDDGSPYVVLYGSYELQAANDPRFLIILKACNVEGHPPGCLGIHFVRLTTYASYERDRLDQVASEFHTNYNFSRVYAVDNDTFALDFYAMTDHGVTWEHLNSLFLEFDSIVGYFGEMWYGPSAPAWK